MIVEAGDNKWENWLEKKNPKKKKKKNMGLMKMCCLPAKKVSLV